MKKYTYLFSIIIIILIFPLADNFIHFVKPAPLNGDFQNTPKPDFSFKSFLSGDFQKKEKEYLKENLNIYPLLVKLNNQLQFNLFKHINLRNAIVGKGDILFDITYINAYYGNDYRGDTTIKYISEEINFMNKILKLYNKKLVVCVLPGKPHFYEKYIPDSLKHPKDKTNAGEILKYLDKTAVPNIELTNYLLSIADTSKYAIYPKESIHLSTYSTVFIADTLIKFMNKKLNTDFPELQYTIAESEKPKFYDNDIIVGINIFNPPNYNSHFAYPEIKNPDKKATYRVLTIGDSFYKNFYKLGIHKKYFNSDNYYYYGKLSWPEMTDIYQGNKLRIDFIKNTDIILIYATDATMYLFPYEFTSKIAKSILPFDKGIIREFFLLKLKHNKEWQNNIKNKAKENNISYAEQKERDINYMINKHINDLCEEDKKLYRITKQIKSDSIWYKNIEQKAKEKQISTEYSLMLDAIYIYNKNNKKQ